MIKKFLFVSIFLIGCISPLNAETKKEYTKYNFYEECLDKELPENRNNNLINKCLKKANEKLDSLIQKRISSKGDCQKEGFESLACSVRRSQESFKSYYQTECTWNMYGAMYSYCEMMLKKDRLKWLDKTLGDIKNN